MCSFQNSLKSTLIDVSKLLLLLCPPMRPIASQCARPVFRSVTFNHLCVCLFVCLLVCLFVLKLYLQVNTLSDMPGFFSVFLVEPVLSSLAQGHSSVPLSGPSISSLTLYH